MVEIRTYRFKGHSMSDPRKYRTKEEEQRFEAEDPIEKLAAVIMKEHGMPAYLIAEIHVGEMGDGS